MHQNKKVKGFPSVFTKPLSTSTSLVRIRPVMNLAENSCPFLLCISLEETGAKLWKLSSL